MSTGTPRLNSAFPETPVAARQRSGNSPARVGSVKQPSFAPKAPTTNPKPTDPSPSIVEDRPPLIPEDVIDAPTQRLYVVAVFVLLQAWKFYDIARLYAADGDSISELWFCVKWLVLDGCFFGFLPILRIPWLKFKAMFTLCAIVTFSVMDIFVSLKYQLPITAFFGVFWKLIYDRELSITERSVKWYDIANNNSHIQGKYTLYYLPEGAAQINPESTCFCIGDTSPFVTLPIRINGTQPINIEIQRIDLESGSAEMISINHKELKRLLKKAPKEDEPQLRNLPYTVKQPGLYRLTRVTDVSQLEVRIYRSEALVVSCPKANLKISGSQKRDKCKGDMSDIAMEVHGLAPLQITYSREIKGKPTVFSVQSIHPEGFESPLLAGFNSDGTLAQQGDGSLAWAQRREIIVPLNESLASAGDWGYSIDKVVDGCGNTVDYNALFEDGDYVVPKKSSLSHRLMVHDRPRIRFLGCDPQTPIDLPKGVSSELPLQLVSVRDDAPYSVRFAFTPHNKLQSASEHSPDAVFKDYSMKGLTQAVSIKEPGLYSLKSFSSKFCPGEVMEPSSCLVITPPEPSMTMESDEILDKCTSSSIGLTIDLTLVGSPTFELSYRLIKDGGAPVVKTLTIDRTRHQVRFTPEDAGHYAYEFFSLRDKNYANVKLDSKINRVEQTVKPLAGANFIDAAPRKNVCIEEPVEFQVKMQGTPPLNLHYDLIHNGKRHRMSDKNITTSIHTIKTPPLTQGGEYALALTTVEDISGCKIYLESEAKVNVRWQRPKAQFAPVEGKMHVRALEGKPVDIPIRLTGESPWTVRIRNADRDEPAKTFKFTGTNSYLTVNDAGTYYLEEVRDNGCPGSVAGADSTFKISWIDRPKLRLAESVSTTRRDEGFVRQDVCEGDEDSVELAFTGSPPFMVDYDIALKPDGSSDSKRSLELSPQQLRAGLGVATVRLETSRAGLYQYKFKSLADGLYDNPKESLLKNPFTLEQTVHSRPTTSFANPSKVYKYCLDAGAGDDIIPIQLHGIAPFSLTINVKHFSTGKSDIINVPHVETNVFNFRIPNHALTLGSHAVSVLKVKDSRGCVRKTPTDAPHVMVAVADMPTITPHDTQRKDYCVGDRIAFTLAGVPPFAVGYEWNGVPMNAHNQPSQFIRVAEKPGNFTVTGLQDSASDCKVSVGLTSIVHEVPSVRISGGNIVVKGIAEGDQTEISFNFFGTPPFTFTYTRSEIAKKGSKPKILESHSQTTNSFSYSMFASQEGVYEVISIADKFCQYSAGKSGRKD